MRLFTLTVICLSVVSLARAADHPQWQGTWAATAGAAAFAGTWNAAAGAAPDTVGGSWSLRDPNGAELATGTWAAGKQGRVWKGTWQARRPSGQVYDGAWSAQAELPAAEHFSSLFQAAITNAVSGSWRTGTLAGAWTIRAYAQ